MPGWRATVDGAVATPEPFDGALLSLPLPAGEHEAVFTYSPTPIRLGAPISIVSALAVLIALPLLRRR
jgi:uncharacterized membrane protein YfhO